MKFHRPLLTAVLLTPLPSLAQDSLPNMLVLKGTCVQLVVGEEDYSERCEPRVMNTASAPNRVGFYFTTTDSKVITFTGLDGENPSVDTDVMDIDKVLMNTPGQGRPTEIPATGRCSYANPYKGKMTISCTGNLADDRRFDGTFITDNSQPDPSPSNVDTQPTPMGAEPSTEAEAENVDDIEDSYGNDAVQKFGDDSVTAKVGGSFTFNVCNKTNRDVKIALYSKYNNLVVDQNYTVSGWYTSKKNSCAAFPDLPKGDFAFYANNEAGREWSGKDRRLCIEASKFRRIFYADYRCSKKLVRGFSNIEITGDEKTITLSK